MNDASSAETSPVSLQASVVIPTAGGRPASLARLLDALGTQEPGAGAFEVIVVSDAPGDAVAAATVGALPFTPRSIVHGRNRGRAAACNTGVAAALGETVLFLDDDMEPAEGWLMGHLAAHQEHPGAAVIGAAPIAAESVDHAVGRYFARKFDRHLEKLAHARCIGYRDVYTGNFSIRRKVLDEAGGFDEGFTVYGNEDGELALRLADRGITFLFEPKAVARQHQDKDLRRAFADARAKGHTAVVLASKHPAAAGQLRLSRPGSRRRQVVRGALIRATRALPFLATASIRLVGLLERTRSSGVDRAYELLFDYGYWLGVRSATSVP